MQEPQADRELIHGRQIEHDRFVHLFHAMATGVLFHDHEGAIQLANPAAERMLGVAIDDMRGRTAWDPSWRAIREDGSTFPAEAHPARVALATGLPVQNVVMGIHNTAADETRWIRVGAVPYRCEGVDRPGEVFTSLEDITELKTLEQKLRRSEERFRVAAECSNDVLYEWNVQSGEITFFGDARFHLPDGQVSTLQQWVDRLHPDDRDGFVREVREHVASGQRFEREHRIAASDGRWLHIVTRAELLKSADGGASRWVGASCDVTSQREAEQSVRQTLNLFEAVVEGTTDPVYVKGLDTAYLFINRECAARFGKSPREVIGKTNFQLVGPEIAERLHGYDMEVLRTGQPVTFEGDGPGVPLPRRYLITKSPYRNARGEIVGIVGVARDITELRRLEEQFRQAHKMEAVGRLAGGVAHDFNNLLTVILGYIDELLSSAPEEEREALSEVKTAAVRATQLTSQLLAFSRRQVLQPLPTDLNELVGHMDRMLTRVVGEDVRLRSMLAPDLGTARVDRGQFEQVLLNLVVNARDAMPAGGNLTIATSNLDLTGSGVEERPELPPGHYVRMTVTDTGAGMDREVVSRIFEPFFTTKERAGTGLGLATVYGIVKQSGGDVWVESRVGGGTTFTVVLPRIDEPAHRPPGDDREHATPRAKQERILLVEDEERVRGLLRTVLERQGYSVACCGDVPEAIAWLEADQGDLQLVLTDMVMPNGTGLQLRPIVRRLKPGARMLFMSGYSEHAATSIEELPPGASFLQKPFTPRALASKIRELLDD